MVDFCSSGPGVPDLQESPLVPLLHLLGVPWAGHEGFRLHGGFQGLELWGF